MRNRITNKFISVLSAAAAFLIAPAAFASEAAAGAHEGITFMGDWLPRLINFAVIAAVVIYYMKKPAQDFFKNRSVDIAKALQESKDGRERSVAALVEMERKIKDLEAETARMVADAQARAEKDRQALIEEGRKAAQDVQAQVKQGIDIELQKARARLAAEAALLSLDLAESRIKEQIGSQDHERMVKEYVANVGGRG